MKCRSTSFFTFISDGSAVFFDDPFANIETKPSAAFLSWLGRIGLYEFLKHTFAECMGKTGSFSFLYCYMARASVLVSSSTRRTTLIALDAPGG